MEIRTSQYSIDETNGKAKRVYGPVFGMPLDLLSSRSRREELAPDTRPEYLYPGHRIDGIVLGYDEDNFWLVLGDVRVSEERIAIEWR